MLKLKTINKTLLLLLFIVVSLSLFQTFSSNTSISIVKSLFAFDWFKDRDKLSKLKTLESVLKYIDEKYLEPSQINPEKMLSKALESLERDIPELLVSDKGATYKRIRVGAKSIKIDSNVRDFPSLRTAISKALRFIKSNSKTEKSDIELETTAIRGILETLDPHSILLSPDQYKETRLSTSGKFGGLGIIISIDKNGDLVVISPIDDTPAYRAGIKPGDAIKKIEEESTVNMSLLDAVNRMRGEKGTTCVLTIMREGMAEPKVYKIVRDIITVASIESHKLSESVGYVRIKNFQDDTRENLKKHIDSLRGKMPSFKGLVLDLRSNPGGLLEQAIEVTDVFLDKGPIVTTVALKNSIRKTERASQKGTVPDFPIAVLVDAGSASASEIVAGALKNNNRAVILGRQTFGKGSVQTIYGLPEGWALKLTIAQYLTPGDKSIQSYGIMPDIHLIPVSVDRDNMNVFQSIKRTREEDLDGHIETKAAHQEKPVYQVKYLASAPPEEEEEEPSLSRTDSPEDKLKKILQDFEIQTASRIIEASDFSDRGLALQSAARTVKESIKEESGKLETALQKLGIDWRDPVSHKPDESCSPPTAEFALSGGKTTVLAGEEIEAKITVKNNGDCTIYKLWGISQSNNPYFSNREFIIGKIEPGKFKESPVKIKLPKNTIDRMISMKVSFDEKFGNIPVSVENKFMIESLGRPGFAFNYQVIDDGRYDSSGNGNSLIEKGETIALAVSIKNTGNAESEDNLATVRNLSGKGVFLSKGRANIGKLPPNSVTDSYFLFSVLDYYENKDIELDIAVYDYTFRDYIQDKFRLKVHEKVSELKSVKQSIQISDTDAEILGSPEGESPVIGRILAGSVLESDREYGDYLHIKADNPRGGWIKKQAALKTQASPSKDTSKFIVPEIRRTPPRLVLASENKIPLETEKNKIRITGQIHDNHAVRDMYIFVNGKKTFYEAFASHNKKVEPFEALLNLEEGNNDIVIFARNCENLTGRSYFFTERVVPGKSLTENRARIFKDLY